ncbi:MAG: YebC/PmpR family DNA-binding transcriptional regulator [Chloroherpetonaceae bacterium]|nr:YebC/PmpR family DNA-binding transcriptional regulator [Chloroherpetonaceae bacterium]MCS7211980.1 YebC/PmpR family DNA-binding transcriptional regulator [Chloroherpetonaceae bacterium]MDW8020417.1 YebC/PmpR family DNA-binding transcriptional regulator [Chloroherpetonaceae bacterium]MDW8465781.1 YebC/PmpR family DNA-binding transcriptional regulator [Chloroherpetonaceae bacterium]
MGRIFEKRKYRMFARWARMSKAFTKIGREISIAVKMGGPDPDNNPRLRRAIQNARSVNMPKDRVEAAIKRAVSREEADYQEVVYEGYAPHGVALIVEAATDNPTRTVANVRMYFNRSGGSLAANGAVSFMFERKGVFKLQKPDVNLEELELELIDYGAEDFALEDDDLLIYTSFNDFATMQKKLEEKGLTVQMSALQYVPTTTVEVTEEQEKDVMELIEKLEDDDDVQAVYHNMR